MFPLLYSFVDKKHRQQFLTPKELFPTNIYTKNTEPTTSNGQSAYVTASLRRRVKLPLRKHHSFHFQPSQMVTGTLKQTNNRPKNSNPLIFNALNEKSAFKPITPMPKSPKKPTVPEKRITTSFSLGDNVMVHNSVPRICGTNLKRHMSNIETYYINRIDDNYLLSDDASSTSTTPLSSSSLSAYLTNGLHYADLALAPAKSKSIIEKRSSLAALETNKKSKNYNSNCRNNDSNNDRSKRNNVLNQKAQHEDIAILPEQNGTQYATIKFQEVKI